MFAEASLAALRKRRGAAFVSALPVELPDRNLAAMIFGAVRTEHRREQSHGDGPRLMWALIAYLGFAVLVMVLGVAIGGPRVVQARRGLSGTKAGRN